MDVNTRSTFGERSTGTKEMRCERDAVCCAGGKKQRGGVGGVCHPVLEKMIDAQ